MKDRLKIVAAKTFAEYGKTTKPVFFYVYNGFMYNTAMALSYKFIALIRSYV